MYSRILVPIDGSAISLRGLVEAIELARDRKAKLRVVYVIDGPFVAYDAGGYSGDVMQALRDGGTALMVRAKELAAKRGVEAETEVMDQTTQRIADVILDEADTWKADLIVMGTHGREGITRLAMGSFADSVVHGSLVPVLLVRSSAAEEKGGADSYPGKLAA